MEIVSIRKCELQYGSPKIGSVRVPECRVRVKPPYDRKFTTTVENFKKELVDGGVPGVLDCQVLSDGRVTFGFTDKEGKRWSSRPSVVQHHFGVRCMEVIDVTEYAGGTVAYWLVAMIRPLLPKHVRLIDNDEGAAIPAWIESEFEHVS